MAGEAATAQVEPGEDAFPGAGVDVIVRGPESKLAIERLNWGFPVEWQQRPVYNTRLETAMGPNPGMWEQPIAQGRGIVVTGGFFEAHATQTVRSPKTGRRIKQQYRFESGEGSPLLLATVCGQGCFSVVTTRPNANVALVHNRMPPGVNARRGALVVARAVAQPGGQLAKASKSRRVRVDGGPGATGSPGSAWAGDVVLRCESFGGGCGLVFCCCATAFRLGVFCRIGCCRTKRTLAELQYGFERCKHID